MKGLTVRDFAERHGLKERTVKAAMRGERHGPLSRRVLALIQNA